ncbi:unnamed protein product [Pleuronectes platessa]|uniref:Uncharacterized protein n=1 Tax=Pleuronectes platessa TaxID=8262 RepID=A0A9N7U9D2_PLEPL|nr:unnamed protein product [Pleuronectes platessa]
MNTDADREREGGGHRGTDTEIITVSLCVPARSLLSDSQTQRFPLNLEPGPDNQISTNQQFSHVTSNSSCEEVHPPVRDQTHNLKATHQSPLDVTLQRTTTSAEDQTHNPLNGPVAPCAFTLGHRSHIFPFDGPRRRESKEERREEEFLTKQLRTLAGHGGSGPVAPCWPVCSRLLPHTFSHTSERSSDRAGTPRGTCSLWLETKSTGSRGPVDSAPPKVGTHNAVNGSMSQRTMEKMK